MLAQVCQFNLVNVEALAAFFWHVVGMKICGVFKSLLTRLSVESVLKNFEILSEFNSFFVCIVVHKFYFISLLYISLYDYKFH